VSANAIPSHLVQVGKAPKDKQFERNVRDSWRKFCELKDNNSPLAFTADELVNALNVSNLAQLQADNIHREFFETNGSSWV